MSSFIGGTKRISQSYVITIWLSSVRSNAEGHQESSFHSHPRSYIIISSTWVNRDWFCHLRMLQVYICIYMCVSYVAASSLIGWDKYFNSNDTESVIISQGLHQLIGPVFSPPRSSYLTLFIRTFPSQPRDTKNIDHGNRYDWTANGRDCGGLPTVIRLRRKCLGKHTFFIKYASRLHPSKWPC